MIYEPTKIQIAPLCPLQFKEPKETGFYPEQYNYSPKLVNNTVVQIRIDSTLLGSTTLKLRQIFKDGRANVESAFTTHTLSTGYYYANATTSLPTVTEELYSYFEILNGTTLLADSVFYCQPTYKTDIKKITYTHSINDFGVVFANNTTFTLDLECGFDPEGYDSKVTTQDFQEQDEDNKTVYGLPYETEKLKTESNGIPNWLRHKMNSLFLCDTVKINDVVYFRASGAKLEQVDKTYKGLGVYEIELQKENKFEQ